MPKSDQVTDQLGLNDGVCGGIEDSNVQDFEYGQFTKNIPARDASEEELLRIINYQVREVPDDIEARVEFLPCAQNVYEVLKEMLPA